MAPVIPEGEVHATTKTLKRLKSELNAPKLRLWMPLKGISQTGGTFCQKRQSVGRRKRRRAASTRRPLARLPSEKLKTSKSTDGIDESMLLTLITYFEFNDGFAILYIIIDLESSTSNKVKTCQ
jgi:hypothetical protein